jgi:hypothetical protein
MAPTDIFRHAGLYVTQYDDTTFEVFINDISTLKFKSPALSGHPWLSQLQWAQREHRHEPYIFQHWAKVYLTDLLKEGIITDD